MSPTYKLSPPRPVESLLTSLEILRSAPNGSALLEQVEQGHQARDRLVAIIERAFLTFLQNAIDRYERRSANDDPITRVKTRLVSRRLASLSDAASLTQPVFDHAALEQHLIALLWAASEIPAGEPQGPSTNNTAATAKIAQSLTSLGQRLDQAISHYSGHLTSLQTVSQAITCAADVTDLQQLRAIMQDSVQDLLREYDALKEHLQKARAGVDDLTSETTSAKMSKPAAPSDTLLRQLQAEVRRAERHRYPLSLVLIGPDHLSDVGGLLGPQANHEVIQRYVESVSACARAYDVVTHHEPHGVAWLLPETETEQGLQALRKVQQRVTRGRYYYCGRLRPLPTFSASVVSYIPGESPANLLARAQTLAARALHAGPNRVELEQRLT